MKKNLLKVVALGIVASLSFNTFAYATAVTATTEKSLVATATVTPTVYSILLPTAVALTINPLSSPAISSPILPIANKSDVPVKVTASVILGTLGASVTQKPEGKVNFADTSYVAKDFSIKAIPLKSSSTAFNQTTFWPANEVGVVYSSTNYAVPKVDTATTPNPAQQGSLEFLLSKYSGTPAAKIYDVGNGVAGMKIVGEMNPFVTTAWAATDVKVTVKYTMAGVPETLYGVLDAATPAGLAADAMNLMKFSNASSTGSIVNDAKIPYALTNTVTLADETAAEAAIDIPLNLVPGTYTIDGAATLYNTKTGDRFTLPAADLAYTDTDGTTEAFVTIDAGKLIESGGDVITGGALWKSVGTVKTMTAADIANSNYDLIIPLKNAANKNTTIFIKLAITDYTPNA